MEKTRIMIAGNAVIWGATGQAIMVKEILEYQHVSVSAFFDNNRELVSPFENIPIYHDEYKIKEYREHYYAVAIGGSHGLDRVRISIKLKDYGLIPITVIHPSAYVSNTSILKEGVQILPMSKLCPRTEVGEFSIINTGASVDHECSIGKGVHIAPNAVLCGCVEIGDYSFIGANATILPRIKIGKNVIIGAGAVVTKDVKNNIVLAGNPGRELHSNRRID
ncbi:MAG: acetyltransferase [Bacteroidales bacterium]|jgi:sugar O-acyltransferase (sialic acid O-acetyltransferase NeuD family)|nr:acetyltransferase [Bacteroidales bacterium]